MFINKSAYTVPGMDKVKRVCQNEVDPKSWTKNFWGPLCISTLLIERYLRLYWSRML